MIGRHDTEIEMVRGGIGNHHTNAPKIIADLSRAFENGPSRLLALAASYLHRLKFHSSELNIDATLMRNFRKLVVETIVEEVAFLISNSAFGGQIARHLVAYLSR